ncbi:hypothetical protein, partial [Listeria monocytogenes]|uniref:hypothetical protein n=1 Tax=Listeria monocytogenes TaxID=1639 RepID=UPI001A7E06C0
CLSKSYSKSNRGFGASSGDKGFWTFGHTKHSMPYQFLVLEQRESAVRLADSMGNCFSVVVSLIYIKEKRKNRDEK